MIINFNNRQVTCPNTVQITKVYKLDYLLKCITAGLCIPLTRRVAGGGAVATLASTLCVAMMLGSWLA